MFNLLRSISLRRLIVAGFGLATLPLLIALASAVMAVEELAELSQATAYRVSRLGQSKEVLRERLTDLERKAKRFAVLGDAETRNAFNEAYRDFAGLLLTLSSVSQRPDLRLRLNEFAAAAESVRREVLGDDELDTGAAAPAPAKAHKPIAGKRRMAQLDSLFEELGVRMRDLVRFFSEVLNKEVKDLEDHSQALQREMLEKSAILLPVSLALITVLTILIIRSVRQMDRAIRRLGSGELSRPVEVRGLKDIEYLGARLDWLRTRLHALEEAKQQFIRHVSHEIKSPLATIHEGTELLADEVVGELNTEQREIAQILVSSTQKLDALVAELINYSQVNTRPGALRRERVAMDELVRSTIADSQIRLRAKSIVLKERLQPVQLDGNPEQLRTIVDNLLSNAIKYTPPEGEIRISLRQAGGHMELEVEDDGPGIDLQERQQVFEPFFQGRAAHEGAVGGTGLGLAIVSECVAGHHGKADALEPRVKGGGARIRVTIPLKIDD